LSADLLLPAAFAVLASVWVILEGITKDRLAIYLLAGLLLVRVALQLREEAAETNSGAPVAKPLLTLAVDEYNILRPEPDDKTHPEGLPPIPQRFIDGCFGDVVEAERRWRLTVQWREEFKADTILEQEHPNFDLVKECLPHYYCYTGYDGNPVYYERSGQVDLAKARKVGINYLVWHYVYMTEFLYEKIHQREDAKTITVFDVQGVGIKEVAGEPFEFIRKASHIMQEHYPERCKVIMIVNTPGWFSFVWKMIRPLVNETTQKKIRIVRSGKETFECLSEFVDPKFIPEEYGGQLSYGGPDTCRWHSPEEVKLQEHVHAINRKFGKERRETPPAAGDLVR